MRRDFTTMTLRISETACSGSTSVLPPPISSRSRHQRIRSCALYSGMLTMFCWLTIYMPHEATINGSYYANLLQKLREAIKQNRLGKLSRVPLLLHENALANRSQVFQAALRECDFEELKHPAYSPDLAPKMWLLPISKLEEISAWAKILWRQCNPGGCGRVAERTVETLLFVGTEKAEGPI